MTNPAFRIAGVALAAGGVYLAQTRHRLLLYWALGMVAFGVAAMIVLSELGGVGEHGSACRPTHVLQ